jgi:acid phosphatase type 7
MESLGRFAERHRDPRAEGGGPVSAAVRRIFTAVAIAAALVALSASQATAQDPVIAAAGDIACNPTDPDYNAGNGTADRCRQRGTSDLLVGAGLAAVLPLGDILDTATLSNIMTAYHPTWGRVKSITRPALGNHESSGRGYFDYFNGPGATIGPAGIRGKGWYSFNVGNWHLIALNSNCRRTADTTDVVDCGVGSEQERWLRADLAAHPTSCTLAYSHHPRWSSGHDGSSTFMQPLWQALYDAHAEILLSGHSHDYERFAPLDANGNVDRARGIRQFVVGTGGIFFTGGLDTREAHSEVAQNNTFGVLKLTLHPTSFDWRFVPIAGRTFTDSGSGACHSAAPPPPPPPPPPADTTAPVISNLRVTRKHFRRRTKFRFELSEAAGVRYVIARKAKGRKGRVRYKRVGTFAQAGIQGHNGRRFRGRIGKRRLKAGVFRARVRARDGAGNRSRTAQVRFRILR